MGRPNIGPTFRIPETSMAALNAVVGALFGLGFFGVLLDKSWYRPFLVALAAFDVLAEFVFHGAFRITVSVVVGILLLMLIRVAVARTSA